MLSSLPVTGYRVVAGVRAAPNIEGRIARRTMDPVMVMKRIRRQVPKQGSIITPPVEFL